MPRDPLPGICHARQDVQGDLESGTTYKLTSIAKQGILAASFEYPTGGREAIDSALTLLKGGTVAKDIVLPSRVFTPANVDQGGEPVGR